MKKGKKKSRNQEPINKVLLITAIVKLITELIVLINKMNE